MMALKTQSTGNNVRRVLLVSFGSLCLFHLLFVSAFVFWFGYPSRIIFLHMALTLPLLVMLFVLTGLLFKVAERFSPAVATFVVVLAATAYSASFCLFYALNLATNYGWGSHITLTLLASSVAQVRGLWQIFPLQLSLIAAGLALFVGFLLLLYSRVAPYVVPLLESVPSPAKPMRRYAFLAVFLLYLVAVVSSLLRNYDLDTMGLWQGEPIVSLLQEECSGYFVASPERVTTSVEERGIRADYPHPSFNKRNVVIITVDGLRPANMQVYGYGRNTTPFLQSLKEQGHLRVVKESNSPCPESVCGIMAIFTSKDLLHTSHAAFGLHSLLHDQGYRISFLLAGDHHWYGLSKFYGQDIDLFRDGRSESPYGINDDRRVLRFIDELPTAEGPQLLSFHLMSAHIVGNELPDMQHFLPASKARFTSNPDNAQALINGYDNGVLQADYVISQIFAKLSAKRYLDDSIVVITADHGEGLGEHGYYGHIKYLYQEFLNVPLLIYDQRPTNYQNLEYGSSMDIAPTVLDLLGLPSPSTWEGRSLLLPPTERLTLHLTPGMSAILARDGASYYSYIRAGDPSAPALREELYDLRADPKEQQNLMTSARPSLVQQLRGEQMAASNGL